MSVVAEARAGEQHDLEHDGRHCTCRGVHSSFSFEADLEAVSPGRTAAHDGHGRLAEARRASFVNVHVTMTHAARLPETA